jgi:hypothetical protein
MLKKIALTKHQVCPFQGTMDSSMSSSTMNTLIRKSYFQIKMELVSHTFKTAYVFMKHL